MEHVRTFAASSRAFAGIIFPSETENLSLPERGTAARPHAETPKGASPRFVRKAEWKRDREREREREREKEHVTLGMADCEFLGL